MHTIRNANGLVLRAIDLGASIVEFHAPDRDGRLTDIVLGYGDHGLYETNPFYLGAVVGRCANRIARGRFELDGRAYRLATNNGPNHLHGGEAGFGTRAWRGERADDGRGEAVRFSLTSPDGDQGYPGALEATVTYTLTDGNELVCEMVATADAPTVCNLAQHTYWNLAGHDAGTVRDHVLTLHAEAYTPLDATQIPTGAIEPVAGTPFDFRSPEPLGRRFGDVGTEPAGYDHNFVIAGEPGATRPVAEVRDPASGRVMRLMADQPGVQLYTGNYLDGSVAGKGGARYGRHAGLCLETQAFPNAINTPAWHTPGLLPVLRPGETYRHTMVFAFSTDAG